jgi:hypothetical protein
MEPIDYEEMARELAEMRKRQKRQRLTAAAPTGSAFSGKFASVIYAASMDFASLYPSTMTMIFGKHTAIVLIMFILKRFNT